MGRLFLVRSCVTTENYAQKKSVDQDYTTIESALKAFFEWRTYAAPSSIGTMVGRYKRVFAT
jgi:hypothetical protein